MSNNIEKHLSQFYHLLSVLESLPDQGIRLSCLPGKKDLPFRGVYFFREREELWSEGVPRVVRVGTHAIFAGAKSSLHSRLKTHLGTQSGSGSHRGSIFRLHVGQALLNKENCTLPTWGNGSVAPLELRANPMARESEAILEKNVSSHIGAMTILWIDVPDEPSKTSMRAFIERNAIALLSNHLSPVALASETWLGRYSARKEIRTSLLWNVKHVDETYAPAFLDVLEQAIEQTGLAKEPE
jgi:hypothetical protein